MPSLHYTGGGGKQHALLVLDGWFWEVRTKRRRDEATGVKVGRRGGRSDLIQYQYS